MNHYWPPASVPEPIPGFELVWLLVGLLGGTLVSLLFAGLASRGRASALWGLLGPIGWLTAAYRGKMARIAGAAEANEKADN